MSTADEIRRNRRLFRAGHGGVCAGEVRTAVALLVLGLTALFVAACSAGRGANAGTGSDRDNPLNGYTVKWDSAELFRPRSETPGRVREMGTRVLIRGHLESGRRRRRGGGLEDGLSLRVGISCRSEELPSWDSGPGRAWLRRWNSNLGVHFGSARTIEVESELAPDGSFIASFPARLLERVVGGRGRYATLLGVPTSDGIGATDFLGKSLEWTELEGPAPLSLTLQRINAVSSPGWGTHDPVALVRAVNHLRSMGRDGALSALEEYLARLGHENFWPGWVRDARNIDTGSPACVFGIVQLLFEPIPGRAPMPRYSTGLLLTGPAPEHRSWEGYPFWMEGDLPFLIGEWADTRGGLDTDPTRALDWASESSRLRSRPLRPTNDPISALRKLELVRDLPPGNQPRLQLMNSFGDLVEMPFHDIFAEDGDALGFYQPDPAGYETVWRRFEFKLTKAKLRWDASAQTYRRS